MWYVEFTPGGTFTNELLGIAVFFTVMTIAEGGGKRAVFHKLREMYVPTLKANFMVWPLVQMINFRLMPIQFQLVGLLVVYSGHELIIMSAFCLISRNCLDSIPIPLKRCRRGRRSISSSIAQHSPAIN